MSIDVRSSIYSITDVLDTLHKHDSEDAWSFASDLTGLSVDTLAELSAKAGKEMCLKVRTYVTSGLCMASFDADGEMMTVYLGEEIGNGTLMPMYCAYLDVNNVPDIARRLEKAGIAEPYTRFGATVAAESGFCTYPLYRFDADKLRKFDPEGMKEYETAYWTRLDEIRSNFEANARKVLQKADEKD